jgi:hypothetical protein
MMRKVDRFARDGPVVAAMTVTPGCTRRDALEGNVVEVIELGAGDL